MTKSTRDAPGGTSPDSVSAADSRPVTTSRLASRKPRDTKPATEIDAVRRHERHDRGADSTHATPDPERVVESTGDRPLARDRVGLSARGR